MKKALHDLHKDAGVKKKTISDDALSLSIWAPNNNLAKVANNYEHQCLNMKYMYFGGKEADKMLTYLF